MRVISKSKLRAFWESRKGDADRAERDLATWHRLARKARWANWGELKQTFGSADLVGNCTVFDVGNNRYRLIARVMYEAGIVYVLGVMDHAEYDEGRWAEECGCHEPPPRKPPEPGGPVAPKEKKPAPGKRGPKRGG
jgi:mRNA interferase HigB